ncbi:MAG: glycoside hydrolase family 127 protein [Ruminococcaceae bacterium]|nr:glycoside hydrolase family 127 protein [Oscillospiraceae bacterium]
MTPYAIPGSAIHTNNGFWGKKQHLNATVTLPAVQARFAETGRFAAWDLAWQEGQEGKPHIYWDSDVAKWIEGVAYSILHHPDPALEAFVDRLVDKLVAHQEADGYFNSYYQQVEPQRRWQERQNHELYCAGHLMEAAVAYHKATGKDKLLKALCRYADYIDRVFRVERSAAFLTPGHEEIELALVRLYEHTGEERYLTLSRYFLDTRGTQPEKQYDFTKDDASYDQSHQPVRRQREATGHAVRAMYLYAAMADVARHTEDAELLEACRRLFHNVTTRRMYVTGGIGSTRAGEAFTYDYDLLNDTAYAETCAAIGLVLFARRMSLLEPDSRYADAAERALYNGVLSGLSLSGDRFFYENPLELDPAQPRGGWRNPLFPITRRPSVFDCSCCPPNLNRLLANIGEGVYTRWGDTLYVHQYMDSDCTDPAAPLTQRTAYPYEGRVTLTYTGDVPLRLALRIPGWCRSFTLTVNGQAAAYTMERGYAVMTVAAGAVAVLDMAMPVTYVEAHPRVGEDAGRVAVTRGPLVYCLEGADNGRTLRDIRLDAAAPVTVEEHRTFGQILRIPARRRADFDGLYRPATGDFVSLTATLIPYHAFANREECEMLVWTLADNLY